MRDDDLIQRARLLAETAAAYLSNHPLARTWMTEDLHSGLLVILVRTTPHEASGKVD